MGISLYFSPLISLDYSLLIKKRICAIEKTEENQWTVILRIYIRLKMNKSKNEKIYRNILPLAPRF